ncbi:MAG: CinA family protein [Granulosicoccus sp.]
MNSEDDIATDSAIAALSAELGGQLERSHRFITTAESCTGGLVAGALTEVAGSSGWFERGVVTYSNAAKQELLGVSASIFEQHGAVSEACVSAMAAGALDRAGADVALSVSGIAGPGGATKDKPVGTVWIGWAIRCLETAKSGTAATTPEGVVKITTEVFTFSGDRRFVRRQAVFEALRGTISRIHSIDKTGSLTL